MKWLIRIILLIIVAFGAAMIFGATRSPLLQIERSIEIAAEPADVFPYMNDLRAFQDWSPWHAMDPAADNVFGGAEYGEGQTMAWKSGNPKLGIGSQTIMESFQDSFVRTNLNFAGREAHGTYAIEPLDNGNVSALIGLETELGGFPFIQRLFTPAYAGKSAADFDAALARLKERAEADVADYEAQSK